MLAQPSTGDVSAKKSEGQAAVFLVKIVDFMYISIP